MALTVCDAKPTASGISVTNLPSTAPRHFRDRNLATR